ncbi:hypothetical protein ZWY2020_027163 [Hordeum vulgare]|nr:hypothetical protein ZWY2020_027163 [Hordeum vulgare]
MGEAAADGGGTPLLDPRTLFRCRAVRRSWRLATSTRSFILDHQTRQPTLPIFPADDLRAPSHTILAFDHRASPNTKLHTVARFDNNFNLEASCDGLLILSKYDYMAFSRTFSVCNPATHEHAFLGLPPWDFKTLSLAMYPHRPTGEYRLLLQRRSLLCSDCYIFALGSDQLLRSIAWPEALLMCLNLTVRVHDSLYWYPKHYSNDMKQVIIVLYTMAESFRMMDAPIVPANSYIFEIDDTLGIYSQSSATKYVDIWVLQNYGTLVWEFKYRIELPVAEIRGKSEGCDAHWDVDVVSMDGGVLLLVSVNWWLLHVDSDGKLIVCQFPLCSPKLVYA